MKNVVVVVLFLMSSVLMAQNGRINDQKIFGVKSGKIEYRIEGKTKGSKTLWWDDYGRLQCEVKKTSTKMMGMTTNEEVMTIRNRKGSYHINLIEKTGTFMSLEDEADMTEALAGTSDEAELKRKAEEISKGFDAKDVGTETILGRTCIVMEIGKLNGKHWRYKEIPLKMEVKMGGILGNSVEEAISFDENTTVPASRFEVPADIIIQKTEMPAGFQGLGF
jgi:hypothetical protein